MFLAKIDLKKPLENHDLFEVSHVFQPSFDEILAICWTIFMQISVLERLLVLDYKIEIWIRKFEIFMLKLGSEVEIC